MPDFATRGLGSRSGRVILLCARAKHFTFVLSPLRITEEVLEKLNEMLGDLVDLALTKG